MRIQGTIAVPAEVIRLADASFGLKRFGLRFLDVSEADREAIRDFVEARGGREAGEGGSGG